MKRLAAFFLSLLMLLGSCVPENDLGELAKLPELVKHYRFHHSAAGGGLTLGEFLVEHYGSGTKEHFGCTFSVRHQQDHQGLPLHGRHGTNAVNFLVAHGPHMAWAPRIARPLPAPQSAGAMPYRFQPSASLLQPPRA